MKTLTTFSITILLGLSGIVYQTSHAQETPAALKPVGQYAGVWDSSFSILPQGEGTEAPTFTGVVKGKWVVGKKFLEQTGTYTLSKDSPPFIIKTIMSYDARQKHYQYDYYNSSGEIQRSFGKWNPETKTMMSTMSNEGDTSVTTITANFSNPDLEQWSIETKNKEGKTIMKIVGSNKRRKSKPSASDGVVPRTNR